MPIVTAKESAYVYGGTGFSRATEAGSYSTLRGAKQCTGTLTADATARIPIATGVAGGTPGILAFTLTWQANRTPNQRVRIYDSDGTTLLDTVYVSGQVVSDDFIYNTGRDSGTSGNVGWTIIGVYSATGATLYIETDNSGLDATKYAITDAVYWVPVSESTLTDVYAPKRSGNWSSPSTWKMGAVPPPNVPILLKQQSPSILTADVNVAVGTSGATGTAAVTIGLNCSLVVADGVTFQTLGDVVQDQVGSARTVGFYPLQIGTGTNGGGAIFEFNSSAATTPFSQKYVVRPTGIAQANACVKSVGTAGNRAIIRSNAGGGNGWLSTGGQIQQNGQHNFAYTDFLRIGDATNPAMAPQLTSGGNTFTIANCRFTACGKIDITYSSSAAYYSITNSQWYSTAASSSLACIGQGSNAGLVDNCRFDKVVSFSPPTGITVTNNHFAAGYTISSPYFFASWQYNIVQASVPVIAYNGPPNAGETYWVYDSALEGNPHPFVIVQNVNTVVSGHIFDMPFGTNGDMVSVGPGASNTLVVTNSILLPNANNGSPGELISPGAVGLSWTGDHNTVCSTSAQSANAESGVGVYGETYAGATGMYASLRSNIVWSPTGKGAFLLRHVLSTVSDPVASSGGLLLADYNCANNPVTTTGSGVNAVFGPIGGYVDTVGTPTNPMFTSTPGLGVHDILADPAFVDPTRNWATFDSAYLGNNPASWATGTSYSVGDIVKTASSGMYGNASINYRCIAAHTSAVGNATNGQPGVASSYQTNWEFATNDRMRTSTAVYNGSIRQATPRDVWTWVHNGFAPTNIALHNTAHDGFDIGAVAWQAAATASAPRDRHFPRGMNRGLDRGAA